MTDDTNCEPCDGHAPVIPRARPQFHPVTGPLAGGLTPAQPPSPQDRQVAAPVTGPRLTVIGQTYYQAPDEPPVLVEERFTVPVSGGEQVFTRRLVVGDEKVEVDFGWLEEVAMLVIENRGGPPRQTIPTHEERWKEASCHVFVFFNDVPGIIIAPGQSARFHPNGSPTLFLRCPKGYSTRVTYTAFPG